MQESWRVFVILGINRDRVATRQRKRDSFAGRHCSISLSDRETPELDIYSDSSYLSQLSTLAQIEVDGSLRSDKMANFESDIHVALSVEWIGQ